MKKVVELLTCDSCGNEIPENTQSTVRIADRTTGKTRLGDFCNSCAKRIPTSTEITTPGKAAKGVRDALGSARSE